MSGAKRPYGAINGMDASEPASDSPIADFMADYDGIFEDEM
jgi:hypothetical protein